MFQVWYFYDTWYPIIQMHTLLKINLLCTGALLPSSILVFLKRKCHPWAGRPVPTVHTKLSKIFSIYISFPLFNQPSLFFRLTSLIPPQPHPNPSVVDNCMCVWCSAVWWCYCPLDYPFSSLFFWFPLLRLLLFTSFDSLPLFSLSVSPLLPSLSLSYPPPLYRLSLSSFLFSIINK